MESFYVLFSVMCVHLETSPHLLQLFSCFAVKPNNCFVEFHLTNNQHDGEWTMITFTFFGEVFL